jgi:hypothetical protein
VSTLSIVIICMTVVVLGLLWALVRVNQAKPQPQQRPGARPTHPDGTPYRYAEIVAEGWDHCDACHTWGQGWTFEHPHVCPVPIRAAQSDQSKEK